jgi:colanic acid biosynthesis glycosyl transferase WcaI
MRLRPLAGGLARRGHQVEVVCEMPNHPQGIVYPGYGGRSVVRRDLDGARVNYVWVYTSTSKRARARVANYASYAAVATLFGATRKRPDVILASSPPLPVAVVGAVLSKRFRVPWVMDVRDLWPEVGEALGELSYGPALRIASWLERSLYRNATAITTVTEPFVDHIARFTQRTKIHRIPNGTTQGWLDLGQNEVDRAELGMPNDRFVWTYAGNVGLSQGLEVAIEAAERLGDGFQLLIVGDGASRKRLLERAASMPNGRVAFRDAVPVEVAARFMRASDALLVSLADAPALGKTIPVKLYDSCAVGRPVVVAAPGEPRRLAAEDGAGIAVLPGDPGALAEAVRKLASDHEFSESIAERGRAFAAGHLREQQVPRLEQVLAEVADHR